MAKWSSTTLVDDGFGKDDINKALLDLLSKANTAYSLQAGGTISGNLSVTGSATVTGAVTLNGGLTVVGTIQSTPTTFKAVSASLTTPGTGNTAIPIPQSFLTGFGSYVAATGVYTVKAAGTYQVAFRAAKTAGIGNTVSILQNAVNAGSLMSFSSALTQYAATIIRCAANDTLVVVVDGTSIALTNVSFEITKLN